MSMPFTKNRDLNIHYETEGDGPPLVLIHGGVSSLEDWYDTGFVGKLMDKYKLILIDLRGHGKSDYPKEPSGYSYDLFIEDIISVLDDLGIEKFHVAGFSFGGWFVYGLADAVPNRLLSMTVLDGVPSIHDGENIKQILGNEEVFTGFAGMFPQAVRDRMLSIDKEHYVEFADALSTEISSIIQRIEKTITRTDIPCLVVTSEYEDGSAEFELLKKTADTIPGAYLVTKSGFSHPEILIRSDETIPHLKEFLDSL